MHTRRYLLGLVLCCTGALAAESPVRVEPVVARPVTQQIVITGTVTSPRSAVLSTAVAGLVARWQVDQGDRVAAEDTLLVLDSELAELALARTQADLRGRQADLKDAQRRLAQAEKVGASRGIAQTEIDGLRAEVSSDEAAVAAARAAALEQQARVQRHTVKAPFAGVISQRFAEAGEWINPGDGLFELVATDNLRLDFQVGQAFYPAISANTNLTVTLDALPSVQIPATVQAIVPVKDPSARTFLVRAAPVTPADGSGQQAAARMTPGMSIRGTLSLGDDLPRVVVSRDALLRFSDGRTTVFRLDSEAQPPVAYEQEVVTGTEFDGQVEIVSGLAAGDLVVVRGNETLRDGQAVTVLKDRP